MVWVLLLSTLTMAADFFSNADSYRIQKTLKATVRLKGKGLHSGAPVELNLRPAEPGHGIVFLRTDCPKPEKVKSHHHSVVATALATSLGVLDKPESRISTVEHLLAALFALGITNALIEVNGPEIPILDGSAFPFIEAFLETGIHLQAFSAPTIRILKPVKVYERGAICELLPRNQLRLTTSIDFPHPSIGAQTFALEVTPRQFIEEVSQARTFGFERDVEKLKAMNLAQGAGLENVLAFSENGILNPEGMRFHDECVRHKLLDALGDLALCGHWVEGELVSFRGGHAIHLTMLKALETHPTHWEILPAEPLHQGKAIPLVDNLLSLVQ